MSIGFIIFIIAQILGLISWLILIYSYTKEDIDELLFYQILVSVFDVASYLLLGADAGLLICLIELVKTYLYYKSDKDRLIFNVSIIFYILVGLLTVRHWFAIFPVVASLIDSYGASKDSRIANIASVVSNTLWTIYDLIILSYIGAFNDIVVVICNILILFRGYSRLMRISKFRIIKTKYLSKTARKKIYELDLKNYGSDNLWDKDYQYRLFLKNKESFFLIIYKHDIVGYVNYLNITEETYNKLKNIRKYQNYISEDDVISFKANRKTYLLIESINVSHNYEQEETIKLINKKIRSFIKAKYRQRIYIHGIIGIALTDFEKKVFDSCNFKKIKDLENNLSMYELDNENIEYK